MFRHFEVSKRNTESCQIYPPTVKLTYFSSITFNYILVWKLKSNFSFNIQITAIFNNFGIFDSFILVLLLWLNHCYLFYIFLQQLKTRNLFCDWKKSFKIKMLQLCLKSELLFFNFQTSDYKVRPPRGDRPCSDLLRRPLLLRLRLLRPQEEDPRTLGPLLAHVVHHHDAHHHPARVARV